ncbi:MAG: glycosyltransferase, partial [Candidatus Sericytochromatia bacterium]
MKFWLIGPREQDPLDAGIERSRLPFPVRFFSARNPVAPLAAGAAGVLLLEPLKRLLPPDIFSLDLPLIGLCSPSDLPAALTRRLLALLDGVIPLEAGPVSPKDSLPGLPLSPVTVWNLGPQHRPLAEPMPLFARSYVTQHSWSPFLPLYEQLASKPAYFIGTHPGRLPFYLQRSSLVLMDEPLNSLYLQALACGAKLALPAASPALGDLGALLNAEDYLAFAGDEGAEAQLAAYTAAPPPAGLGARLDQLRLASTLPRALQSLANLGPGPRDPLPIALQLACLTRPQALQRLEASLKTRPEGSDRDFLTLCFYQRLLQSPLAPTDKAPIHAAVAALLSQLPPGPERELIQLSTWIGQPEQEIQALSLLLQLQGSPPDFERISQPAAWLQDPVLGELLSLYDSNRALSAWLGYQEAVCLARLQRAGAARDRLEALLDQGYFPAAASLWQALQDQVPPTAKTRRWLDKHPQNLDLTLLWIRGLDEQAALNACAAARELCRRHLTRSADLEKFLALERQLRGEEPAPGVHVLWEGPLHAHSSLAAINQRWLLALLEQPGFRVTHIPFEPPELPPEPATQALEQIWTQPVDVYVSHRWPPRNSPPTAGKWASIIPWEFGVIPESWARQLNAQLDRIWVPSAFVAQSFEISGVEADLLQVIPNGVDTQLLNPDGPRLELATQQGFRFLFVGGMLDRKGLDLLLDAYAAAFSRADDVVLVIKGFGSDSHYALHPFHHQLEALRSQPLAPAVLYLDQDLSAAQMAALYRACDVYVHPYRGEGFGMPILEAMACGLPVIIPNAGPAPEFCPPDAGWQVPTRIRFEPGCDVQGLGLAVTHPYYAEVDVTQLAASLKQAQSDPAECQRRGAIAATAAQVYDWQLIFPLLADQITALARQATP